MVDVSRLMKKAFIADKQGLEHLGNKPESEEKKKEREETLEGLFARTGLKKEQEKPEVNQPKGSSLWSRLGDFFSKLKNNAPRVPAATGVYIGLIILSIIALILKRFVAYHPGGSLFITIILAFFFLIAVHYTPEARIKIAIVWVVFALDAFIQFILGLFPESEFKNWLITYYVFGWVILAVVLFLMGVFDTMGAGEHLGKGGVLVLVLIIGFALFLLFPILITGPIAKQDETHAEYYHIAKAQIVKVADTLEETKNVWHDYFTCTFCGPLGSDFFCEPGGSKIFDGCVDDKRITRYCENNFKTATERQNCIKQQQDLLKSGGKAGIAGSVSEALKQVTKIELNIDDFFPKKTTDTRETYPISLDIQNPREQTFTASVSCSFKKGKDEIIGKTSFYGEEVNQIQIGGFSGEQQIPITCQPTTNLNGRYTLEYNVILSGMQTFSFLKRAFISKEISAELRKQVEADNFKSAKEKASQGPAEFALLNFKFGTGVGTEPLVLVEEPTRFSFAVEDVGSGAFKGEVLKVNSYNFHGLWERGFSIDPERLGDQDCLQGGEILLLPVQTKKREPSELKTCFLVLSPDLRQLKKNEYKVETFVADLNYDYKITKSIPIEVTPLETFVCGNGVLESGEECDDGNQANTDACTNRCKNAVCGDKFVQEGIEQCDDGNTISGDGCSSCQLEAVS